MYNVSLLHSFMAFYCLGLGTLDTHLIVKVLRPGDSEVTFSIFDSSCHLLLPVLPLKGRVNSVKCLA